MKTAARNYNAEQKRIKETQQKEAEAKKSLSQQTYNNAFPALTSKSTNNNIISKQPSNMKNPIHPANKAAEEKAKKETEAKKESEEKARKEAEAKAAEEKAKQEAEAKKEAEEKAGKEAEAKRIAEEKAKQEAETKAAEEKAKPEKNLASKNNLLEMISTGNKDDIRKVITESNISDLVSTEFLDDMLEKFSDSEGKVDLIKVVINKINDDKTGSNPGKINLHAKCLVKLAAIDLCDFEKKLEKNKESIGRSDYAKPLENLEKAYNMICSVKKDQDKSLLSELLCHMATIHTKLGDDQKVEILKNQINSLQNVNQEKKGEAEEFSLTLIRKTGTSDEKLLEIKEKLQTDVLNPIHDAAARGKWFEHTIGMYGVAEYGVAGYVGKEYITKCLGDLYDINNYKIALELCFEAINLGIMASDKKNPLVAHIFAQEYRNTISNVLKDHPEYFVDGLILKSSIPNPSDWSEELLGQTLSKNEKGYNKFFEDGIINIIEDRIELELLKLIKKMVQKGDWSNSIDSSFKNYLSTNYIKECLGNNLSEVEDTINIARILIFKAMNEGLESADTKNMVFFEKFIPQFLDIMGRICEDHNDYLYKDRINETQGIINRYKNKSETNLSEKKDLNPLENGGFEDLAAPDENDGDTTTDVVGDNHDYN